MWTDTARDHRTVRAPYPRAPGTPILDGTVGWGRVTIGVWGSLHVANKQHIQTGRVTFESVIRELIGMDTELLFDDWRDLLDIRETPHLLHRSWTGDRAQEVGTAPIEE